MKTRCAVAIPLLVSLIACGGNTSQVTPTADAATDAPASSAAPDGGFDSGEANFATYAGNYQTMNWLDDAGDGTIDDIDKAWHWSDQACEYIFQPNLNIHLTLSQTSGGLSVTSASVDGTISTEINLNPNSGQCPLHDDNLSVPPTAFTIRSDTAGLVAEGTVEWAAGNGQESFAASGTVTIPNETLHSSALPQSFGAHVVWNSPNFTAPNVSPTRDVDFGRGPNGP